MAELYCMQILSILLTSATALMAVVIAYWQWRTAHNKLKLDLFEKRFAVYYTARNFFYEVVTWGEVSNKELSKFFYGTREAKWLLDDDIAKYFDEVLKKAHEFQGLEIELQEENQKATDIEARQSEITKWFSEQYKVLDEKFSPFVRLSH